MTARCDQLTSAGECNRRASGRLTWRDPHSGELRRRVLCEEHAPSTTAAVARSVAYGAAVVLEPIGANQ